MTNKVSRNFSQKFSQVCFIFLSNYFRFVFHESFHRFFFTGNSLVYFLFPRNFSVIFFTKFFQIFFMNFLTNFFHEIFSSIFFFICCNRDHFQITTFLHFTFSPLGKKVGEIASPAKFHNVKRPIRIPKITKQSFFSRVSQASTLRFLKMTIPTKNPATTPPK